MARRVTLARVAAEAGVSPATVSKVVNGRGGVGEATRESVEHLIAQLGYVAVAERQRPKRGLREPLVEVLVDSLDSPYTWALLAGIVSAAEAARGAVVTRVLRSIDDRDSLEWAQRLARAGRVGVIEASATYSKPREDALRAVGLPLVLVDPIDERRRFVHSLSATNWAGGVEATQHLLDLGHTRIAFIGGPSEAAANIARLHGYLASLRQADISEDPTIILNGSFTMDHGIRATTEFLGRRERPTAIFAASDSVALGAIEAARRLGLNVPADVSIIGFDDTGVAPLSGPPLTTIHQPIFEIGQTAVNMIFRLAGGESPPTKRIELATHLVIRASTAPPPIEVPG